MKWNDYESSEVLEDMLDDNKYVLPAKLSMRHDENSDGHKWKGWDYGHHAMTKMKQFWAHADAYLESCVGKDYDESYSIFCKKFPKRIGYEDTREWWHRNFRWRRWRYGYTVDVDNKIIPNQSKTEKPRKYIVLEETTPELRYYIKKEYLTEANQLQIKQKLGPKVLDKLLYNEYLDESAYLKLIRKDAFNKIDLNEGLDKPIMCRRYYGYPKYRIDYEPENIPLCKLFDSKRVSYEYRVYKGDYRYERALAEQIQLQKKDSIERKKALNERNSYLLKAVEEKRKENNKETNED